ncbi:PA14 domain-containing protein [Streptomyces rhizosphaerihabitans]|uniref:PA14 domain-containing protein n=1 Tax=Streptomyces rhizosphaerihabitans TaxID=1266770 RepID=UPI0021C0E131|nr:PA14 domain-containing protein [Streptomyces rhizosphaerihabitans]MCT9010641.1 PA14 domain-containing protein [Streptomyces rhizosphaerihabitans]
MHHKRSVVALTGGALSATVLGGLLAVAPQAAADVTCGTNVFKRTFYKNSSFSGAPAKTDCDNAVSQSWSGSPVTGLPGNGFGVRWTVTRDFGSGGPFTFAVSATDGVRVYLDSVRKIDLWSGTGDTPRSKSVNLTVPAGRHTLRVDYVNWTGAAKVAYSYTPRTTATVDKVKPLAPTGVKTAYDTKARRTTVSWSANKEMDLASYTLYRRPVGSSTWTKVTTTTARSFTDPLANPDDRTPYYYEVRAKDKAGNTSSGSTDTVVRPLPEVTSLSGTYDKATGKVALNWPLNTEPQFDHYTVLSNDKVDGSYVWVPLGTTKGHTWTVGPVTADGETRHYRVLVTNDGGTTTYNPDWLSASATNELWLAIPDGIAPAEAPDLTLRFCAAGIEATATDYTPSAIRDFYGFEIERREAGTATWSVAVHKAYDPRLTPAAVSVCDPLPADGRTYEYRARTYDGADNYSPYSDIRALTTQTD